MDGESYRTKTGKTRYRPVVTEDELAELDTTGFCVACGAEVLGVEPDARQYACEGCGEETGAPRSGAHAEPFALGSHFRSRHNARSNHSAHRAHGVHPRRLRRSVSPPVRATRRARGR